MLRAVAAGVVAVALVGCGDGSSDLAGAPDVRGVPYFKAVETLKRAGWKSTLCGGGAQVFLTTGFKVSRERRTGDRTVDLELVASSHDGSDVSPGTAVCAQ